MPYLLKAFFESTLGRDDVVGVFTCAQGSNKILNLPTSRLNGCESDKIRTLSALA